MKTEEQLQNDVLAELNWDPALKNISSAIGVSARDGVVTLSGPVESYSQKIAAEKAAQRVHGVQVVAVDMEVKIPSAISKSDTEIAQAIRNALLWNANVKEDKIEVKVDDGWVYLAGTVDWGFERRVARTSIEDLAGVRGITNNIRVKAEEISEKDIKSMISSAFRRQATLDSSALDVTVRGSIVALGGSVRTWFEKEEAERVAWACPGVFHVNNNIRIGH